MTLRTLVCDDEQLAVGYLSSMLDRISGVEVVGTTTEGGAVLSLVRELVPDLLFLDVEMPGCDGFGVIEELAGTLAGAEERAPLVVFVSALPRFTADTAGTGVLDVLTKPVRPERLLSSVGRAREASERGERGDRLIQLRASLRDLRSARSSSSSSYVWGSQDGEVVRVDLDDVERVSEEGASVRLHSNGRSYLHCGTLDAIGAMLDRGRFLQVHRSHLVRMDQVASLRRTITGGSWLVLSNGAQVPVERGYARQVARRLADMREKADRLAER